MSTVLKVDFDHNFILEGDRLFITKYNYQDLTGLDLINSKSYLIRKSKAQTGISRS